MSIEINNNKTQSLSNEFRLKKMENLKQSKF